MNSRYVAMAFLGSVFLAVPALSSLALAQTAAPQKQENSAEQSTCDISNRICIQDNLLTQARSIEEASWRDQTLRELAKSLAADGQIDKAAALIHEVGNSDTRAMTIRGISMEIAKLGLDQARMDAEYAKLRAEAEKIDHPPSYAIALTYIAMGQAFAGDDEGAWKTAADMENAALRNKAYGETAEIQAEAGKFEAAVKTIGFMDDEAFKNKTYNIVSKILADKGLFEDSYKAALAVTNAYKKTQSIQYMLDRQKDSAQKQEENTPDAAEDKKALTP